jgi:hypothetical protein
MKRIYFAGSVDKNDWRNDLVRKRVSRIMSDGNIEYEAKNGGSFIYGGPFAVADDHGCFHRANPNLEQRRHGCGPTEGCSGSYEAPEGYIEVDNGGVPEPFIFLRCMKQIHEADAVLANIEKTDCYGTYFELGFAHALRKPIYLFINPGLKISSDLWFIKQSASIITSLEIPKELLTNPNQEYQKYLNSPEWKYISGRKRQEADNKCQLCNKGNLTLHVHHRTYDNVYKEKLSDLIVLCENCHKKFHDKD